MRRLIYVLRSFDGAPADNVASRLMPGNLVGICMLFSPADDPVLDEEVANSCV